MTLENTNTSRLLDRDDAAELLAQLEEAGERVEIPIDDVDARAINLKRYGSLEPIVHVRIDYAGRIIDLGLGWQAQAALLAMQDSCVPGDRRLELQERHYQCQTLADLKGLARVLERETPEAYLDLTDEMGPL